MLALGCTAVLAQQVTDCCFCRQPRGPLSFAGFAAVIDTGAALDLTAGALLADAAD